MVQKTLTGSDSARFVDNLLCRLINIFSPASKDATRQYPSTAVILKTFEIQRINTCKSS